MFLSSRNLTCTPFTILCLISIVMGLYFLLFDVISEVVLLLDIIDLKKLEIAGTKNLFAVDYLRQATDNFTANFCFHGSRKVAMPLDVLLGYLDKNVGFSELVLSDSKVSVYNDKMKFAASTLKYLSIPCLNTFQEKELLSHCSSLEELRLSNVCMDAVILEDFDCTTVTTLDLSGCRQLRNVSTTFCGFRNLTHLNVSHCYQMKDSLVRVALNIAAKLEVLNIAHCALLTDATLFAVMDVATIKQLGVVGCPNFSIGLIQSIPQRCPNFVGFLQDEPVSFKTSPPDMFEKASILFDSAVAPKLRPLYCPPQPIHIIISSLHFVLVLMCFIFLEDKGSRSISYISTAFGLYYGTMMYMRDRSPFAMKMLLIASFSFALSIYTALLSYFR